MIVKKNLSEQIYDSLKQDILDQKIGFGEKLINRSLQEKYGVSSTPVRDAINRLYVDGLLDNISNVGARVILFDCRMAKEVNEIVSFLNREAIACSAAKAVAADIVPVLERCIEMQLAHINGEHYFEFDKKFHTAFFEFCDNSHFLRLFNQYRVLWELLVLFYYKDRESTRADALAEHRDILAAYKAGDVAQAQYWMNRHFLVAEQHLDKMLARAPADAGE